MIKKTFGGDRIGTGAGFSVHQRTYQRTNKDLGNVFRSNLGIGMAMPCYVEQVKRGDVWDINVSLRLITHPTNGPIFGQYEFRAAFWTGDWRLWNKELHNNPKKAGLEAKSIMFPRLRLNAQNIDRNGDENYNEQQIRSTSLLATTGIRGLGTLELVNGEGRVEIQRNAQPVIMYYEIMSNYGWNKQEDIGVVIGFENIAAELRILAATHYDIDEVIGGDDFVWNWTNYPGNTPIGSTYINEGGSLVVITNEEIEPEGIEIAIDASGGAVYYPIAEIPGRTWTRTYREKNNSGGWNIVYERLVGGDIDIVELGQGTLFRIRAGYEQGEMQELTLLDFPLTNIDDLREQIFAQPKSSPLIIGYQGSERRGLPYDAVVGQSNIINGVIQETSKIGSFGEWAGLGLMTYRADRWNTWLNEEWIDNANNISNVDTSTGSFSMDALALARRIWQFNNDVIAGGGSYQDWLTAIDGMEAYGAPEIPVYRGGMSAMIGFNEVVSSSEAGDQPLGTIGGQGDITGVRGGVIRFKAEENGYIMGLCWIIPLIDYYQGNKWFTKLETIDDLHKPIYDGIGYQQKTTDQIAAWDTKIDENGNETFFSMGYEHAWTEYWTRENEVYGSFTRDYEEAYMVLGRRYSMDENGRIEDVTTNIAPTKYLYPFAYLGLSYGPFWVQLGIDANVRRIMSGAIQPHL